MRAPLALLLAACLAALRPQAADAFFSFKKAADVPATATSTDAARPSSASATPAQIRGVPDQLVSKYQQEMFVCDGGNKAMKISAVNDGYCDCTDGTDEPGTSACSNGAFYCVNVGYKVLKLPSSTVDDTVCDCCDGSDEVAGRCPNTCQQQAETERAVLDMAVNNYKRGSAIREELISSMLDKKRSMTEQQTRQAALLADLDADLERVSKNLEARVQTVSAQEAKNTEGAEGELRALLGLSTSSADYSVQLASALVAALDWTEEQVASHAGLSSELSVNADNEHVDVEEMVDTYGDSAKCDLVDATGNPSLAPLCAWAPTERAEKFDSFVMQLMKTKKPFAEAMVVLGHHKLHGSFDGAADRFGHMVTDSLIHTCPADFEPLGAAHCELKDTLRGAVARWEGGDALVDADAEVQRLRGVQGTVRGQRADAQSALSTAQTTLQDMERYPDHLAFLALKGQCFDVVDGKFSYSLCMMENVKQKELEGHGQVTLGSFDRIEETSDALRMHFTNGQYCHAFGARRAEVTVSCGPEHALRSASEPSTCAYALTFESPAACSPARALASGIAL